MTSTGNTVGMEAREAGRNAPMNTPLEALERLKELAKAAREFEATPTAWFTAGQMVALAGIEPEDAAFIAAVSPTVFLEIAAAFEAQGERLREVEGALRECIEVLALSERPAFPDRDYHAEVKALGQRIGFGALMSTASAGWRETSEAKGYPTGGEFVAGPCYATVIATLGRARSALTQPPAMEKTDG